MISHTDIADTLDDWKNTTSKLLIAVADRNYRNFRKYFSKGCSHFKQVRVYIEQNTGIGEIERDHLLVTAKEWQKTSSAIDVWKEEIRIELKQVRSKLKKTNKINNAYHFRRSKAGMNISRKAK
jgi:hypothetical protein